MKTTMKVLLLLMFTAGMISCESIKSLADVEFDTEMQTDLNIDVQDPTKSVPDAFPFNADAKLDPTSDPEVAKYVSTIQSYQVTSLTAKVKSTTKPGVVFKSGTWFKMEDTSDDVMWTMSEDFSVEAGKTYTLGNDNNEWATVQTIISRNAEFTVSCGGEATETGVIVVMELSIGAKVTANPL